MADYEPPPPSPSAIPLRSSSKRFSLDRAAGKAALASLGESGEGETAGPDDLATFPPTPKHRHRRRATGSGATGSGATAFGADLIDREARDWPAAKEKLLLGPYDYMEGHPGKDIRSQLISAFDAWLHVPRDSLAVIARVISMLHTASLLVDDVEDGSLLRRGVPVAHSIFGTAQTINSANYVYFGALRELQKLRSPAAITIFTEELLNLHRGQGMDLWWRDTLTCPTEGEYLEMVDNKTGGLFRLAVKLMQAESSTSVNCVPLVNAIGLLFQILDDYKNLSSQVYTQNKGLAEDLTEGKFSFPIIHCIRANPGNHILLNILRQKTTDDDVKRYAIDYMERTGSFAYTRERLAELTARALALVDGLEAGSPGAGAGVRRILEKMRVDKAG